MDKFLQQQRIAMIGFGDIQHRLALLLKDSGAELDAYRRNSAKIDLDFVDAQSLDVSKEIKQVIAADYVVMTLSPSERSEAGYRNSYYDGLSHVLKAIDKSQLKKFFWVSSTSVYAQDDGSWVDEASETKPEKATAKILLQCEELLHRQLDDKACTVRFSGIYRDNRHRMIDKIRQHELSANIEQDYFTNRIHVQDCARALYHLLALDAKAIRLDGLYLGSDDEPVKYLAFIDWISQQAGLPLNSELPAVKKSVGSKRIDNSRLKATGFEFEYPSFRQGLQKLIAGL